MVTDLNNTYRMMMMMMETQNGHNSTNFEATTPSNAQSAPQVYIAASLSGHKDVSKKIELLIEDIETIVVMTADLEAVRAVVDPLLGLTKGGECGQEVPAFDGLGVVVVVLSVVTVQDNVVVVVVMDDVLVDTLLNEQLAEMIPVPVTIVQTKIQACLKHKDKH